MASTGADRQSIQGSEVLARIREAELRAAAAILGVRDIAFLDYRDQELDRADPREAVARIVRQLRRTRPDVVLTFAQDGAYGHPDHIAICQFATAAVAVSADPSFASGDGRRPSGRQAVLHRLACVDVGGLRERVKRLISVVDGVERQAVPWPDWSITTVIDARVVGDRLARRLLHTSQMGIFARLKDLQPELHQALWGAQSFYRVLSTVNGGRQREVDMFEGCGADGVDTP